MDWLILYLSGWSLLLTTAGGKGVTQVSPMNNVEPDSEPEDLATPTLQAPASPFFSDPSNERVDGWDEQGFSFASPIDGKQDFSFAFPEEKRGLSFNIPQSQPSEDKRGVSYSQPSEDIRGVSFSLPIEDKHGFSFAQPTEDKRGFSFSLPSEEKREFSFSLPAEDKRGFSYSLPTEGKRGFSFFQPSEDKRGFSFSRATEDKRGFSFSLPTEDKRGFPFSLPSEDKRGFSFFLPTEDKRGFSFSLPTEDKRGFSFSLPTEDKREFAFPKSSVKNLKKIFAFALPQKDKRRFLFALPWDDKNKVLQLSTRDSNVGLLFELPSKFQRKFSYALHNRIKRGFSFALPQPISEEAETRGFSLSLPNGKLGFSLALPQVVAIQRQKRGFSFVYPDPVEELGSSHAHHAARVKMAAPTSSSGDRYIDWNQILQIAPWRSFYQRKRAKEEPLPSDNHRLNKDDRTRMEKRSIALLATWPRLGLHQILTSGESLPLATPSISLGQNDDRMREVARSASVDGVSHRVLLSHLDLAGPLNGRSLGRRWKISHMLPEGFFQRGTKRSALQSSIKVRYGKGKTDTKKGEKGSPVEDTLHVTEVKGKAWWDPKDYVHHPYQFTKNYTPLRITSGGAILLCRKEDLKDFLEVDSLLTSPLADTADKVFDLKSDEDISLAEDLMTTNQISEDYSAAQSPH